MPQVKQSNKKDVVAVFEDPRPSHNHIYLFGDAHNKSTLAPIFDSHIKFVPNSGAWNTKGYNNNNNDENSAGSPGYGLSLAKPTTSVMHTTATGDSGVCNLDISWGLSMDPNNPFGFSKQFTDGNRNMVTWFSHGHTGFYIDCVWSALANTTNLFDITSSSMTHVSGFDGNYGNSDSVYGWFYRDPSNDFISGLYNRSSGIYTGNGQRCRPAMGIVRMNKFPTYNTRDSITYKDYYAAQYIGVSTVDGRPIYLFNRRTSDREQFIIRHNTNDNTETTLYTFNAVPTAANQSAGGDRTQSGAASALKSQIKMSSQTFTDPNAANTKCWYTPYFDTQNNYMPFLFRWNTSNDVFTRENVTNVSGDLSSVHMTNLHGCQGETSGLKSVIANETFVVSNTRYITVIPLDGGHQVNDSSATARSMVTYSANSANPALLTYHSKVISPSTIKNIVWLNDSRTQVGLITERSLLVYNFTSQNGWTPTATIPYQFWAVGRDSTDRIWGLSFNSTGYVDLHLITASIPIRITISTANSTYDYQGTNINSTANISAYNINGARISINVNLSIVGSTLTFSNSATSLTVNTSANAETSVPIVITGAGQSDIQASVQI